MTLYIARALIVLFSSIVTSLLLTQPAVIRAITTYLAGNMSSPGYELVVGTLALILVLPIYMLILLVTRASSTCTSVTLAVATVITVASSPAASWLVDFLSSVNPEVAQKLGLFVVGLRAPRESELLLLTLLIAAVSLHIIAITIDYAAAISERTRSEIVSRIFSDAASQALSLLTLALLVSAVTIVVCFLTGIATL